MDIFRPDQWHDFFLMVGGGAAALTGLVFVAMSINLALIAKDPTHRNRAIGTLTGFSAIFLICAFTLLGSQNHQTIGIEWLAVSIPAAFIYIRGYIVAIRKGGSVASLSVVRLIFGTGCYAAQILGAVVLMSGNISGLYISAIAMVLSFTSLISGAWLLITGSEDPMEPQSLVT